MSGLLEPIDLVSTFLESFSLHRRRRPHVFPHTLYRSRKRCWEEGFKGSPKAATHLFGAAPTFETFSKSGDATRVQGEERGSQERGYSTGSASNPSRVCLSMDFFGTQPFLSHSIGPLLPSISSESIWPFLPFVFASTIQKGTEPQQRRGMCPEFHLIREFSNRFHQTVRLGVDLGWGGLGWGEVRVF